MPKASPRGAAGCPAAEKQQDQLSRGTLAADKQQGDQGGTRSQRIGSAAPGGLALDEAGLIGTLINCNSGIAKESGKRD